MGWKDMFATEEETQEEEKPEESIVNINEQIRAAKATLAKYGTELVKGY